MPLVLIKRMLIDCPELSNEVSKPDEGEDVVQDNSEQEQLRSDVEFLSMMTGVDLGGD